MRYENVEINNTVSQRELTFNVSKGYLIAKRLFDVLASILAIVILFPLFIIVSVTIKIDSPGPIFFIQNRCGFKGKIFKMYKFRSMTSNAEDLREGLENQNEVTGPMFKIKEDPRVTKIGRIIRKTGIDELPQLLNVIKGDMSLVGPRPPLVAEVVRYDIWFTLRLLVKPGITGLWQVSGRNKLGFNEMIRLDLKYIRERGFWNDMKIIFKTIPLLFGDSKAF